MKKYLALILGMLFVLGFTASAFAQTDVKLGGSLTVRGWYLQNLDNDTTTAAGDFSYYDTQYRLKIDATVDKAKAVIELQNTGSGSDKWGTADGVTASTSDFQSGDNANLHFRQAYISFPVLGLNISAGHQLLSLGVKSFFDASKDGAKAILVTYPFDKKNVVGIGTIKAVEGDTILTDTTIAEDFDIYFGLASIDLQGHTLGLNVANLRNNGPVAAGISDGGYLYNCGVTLAGKIDPVSYTVAGDIQFGKANAVDSNKGYHLRGVLGYQATPELGLNLASIYFSGEKTGADVKKFVTFLEDTNYATFVFGYLNRGLGATYGTGTPVPGGYWFNKIGATYKAIKDLSLGLDYINIRGTYDSSVNASKAVGNEVDFTLTYNIAKNLTYNIIGGVLFPGQAYENESAARNDSAIGVRHALSLSF